MDDGQKEEALVFADVAGSVSLYEECGDIVAKNLIIRLQSDLAEVIVANRGSVQEIIGDEILSRFEQTDHALNAVVEMQRLHNRPGSQYDNGDPVNKLQLRIGMHMGVMLADGNRIFGDTVNVAARVAQYAQAGQVLLTSDVLSKAAPHWHAQIMPFRSFHPKGKKDDIELFILDWPGNDQTVISVIEKAEHSLTLKLYHEDRSYQLNARDSLVVGRAPSADIVIDAECVSRRHLRLENSNQGIEITDSSTNGTYVEFATGQTYHLVRQQAQLSRTGLISLGVPIDKAKGQLLKFECDALQSTSLEL